MIYLGQYYEDKGLNTSLNIPRYTLDDAEEHQYTIEIVNNITKNSLYQSENLVNDSSSEYYYSFLGLDTSSLSDGEYTLSLFEDETLVYEGILSYRNAAKTDVSVYNTPTKYVVYE